MGKLLLFIDSTHCLNCKFSRESAAKNGKSLPKGISDGKDRRFKCIHYKEIRNLERCGEWQFA